MPRVNPEENFFPLEDHTPIQQLDAVLTCLMPKHPTYKTAPEIVDELLKTQGLIATESDVTEILNKLVKDGFASCENFRDRSAGSGDSAFIPIMHKATYRATFEGRVLIDYEGGYFGRQEEQFSNAARIQKLEDDQRKIQRRTLRITWFAGIIGALVFIVSLIQLLLYWKERYPLFPTFERWVLHF